MFSFIHKEIKENPNCFQWISHTVSDAAGFSKFRLKKKKKKRKNSSLRIEILHSLWFWMSLASELNISFANGVDVDADCNTHSQKLVFLQAHLLSTFSESFPCCHMSKQSVKKKESTRIFPGLQNSRIKKQPPNYTSFCHNFCWAHRF